MSESPTAQPSFYSITPATVRYNKNLEPHAKLLYGEITALANMYGYCWASDPYFSELYEVDQRTVKRWILSLKKEKLIKVETDRSCFPPKRKIWVTPEVQKMFTSGHFCPDHGDKNVPPINTPEYKKKNNIKRKTKNAAPAITYNHEKRELEGISSEDIKEWQNVFTSVNIRKEIAKCTIWARDNERENYRKALMSFFRNSEKNHTEPSTPQSASPEATEADEKRNIEIANEIEKEILKNPLAYPYAIYIKSSKIEFILPANAGYEVVYQLPTKEFKKKCLSALKKMKIQLKME